MSDLVGIVGLKGNTKPSTPKKQDSTAKRWCFTHNFEIEEDEKKETATIDKIVGLFRRISTYYIFSIEKGEKNSRRHIQGYVELKEAMRLTGVKKLVDETTHWEKSKSGRTNNLVYISKDPIKGPFEWDSKTCKKYTAEELDLITDDMLFDWQKDIINNIISKKAEKRKIYWFWSKEGEVGKTEFIKYLMYHYNAKFCQGAKKDIMTNILGKDGQTPARQIYIFGYPRTNEDFVSYDALECVKDGLLFSSKYESSDAIIPIPHVLVFANFEPDRETMSKDRWIVKNIDKIPPVVEENKRFSINFD